MAIASEGESTNTTSADHYLTLDELKRAEAPTAWHEESINRNSWLLVVAPHGGTIEVHTERIARLIAGDKYSLFIFEGRRAPGRELHVTSTNFRDAQLSALQSVSSVTLSIHGEKNTNLQITYVGGLNKALAIEIKNALTSAGFQAETATGSLAALDTKNFVNLTTDKGVQLEISRGERNAMNEDQQRLGRFVEAVHTGLKRYKDQAKNESR
jgi:phage replication-related protein YjqB (UPF0714/DUF867 family)